ncbi:MAG: 1,4-dihydroxy-6-naphthoate synthase [Fibrobacterales bacterium]
MLHKKITLGISPCPNDTFIFEALINNRLKGCPYTFDVVFHDVQTLNEKARCGEIDLLKFSYGALPSVMNHYKLLYSGGAMGYGCGPLLLKGSDTPFDPNIPVILPGKETTAAALFHFWYSANYTIAPLIEYEFFDILYKKLLTHRQQQGVVIHESRFTYENDGLSQLVDLGAFWEESTKLPIPLGGIALKKELISEAQEIDHWIVKSILYAEAKLGVANAFIRDKAQIDDQAVVDAHIATYVNDFSKSIVGEGEAAINRLLSLLSPNERITFENVIAYT